MKVDTNTLELTRLWGYYGVQAVDPYAPRFHMYIKKVYGGRVEWVTDYTHAKQYKTEKAARAVIEKIRAGVIIDDV